MNLPRAFLLMMLTASPALAQVTSSAATRVAAPPDNTLATPGAVAQATNSDTNAAPVVAPPIVIPPPAPVTTAAPAPLEYAATTPKAPAPDSADGLVLGPLLALAGVAGLVAWYCGLTRARNCGHTCTLLVCGAFFALIGFWFGGFAVQSGGLGDTHAALAAPVDPAAGNMLNHELGLPVGGRFWGVMGSAGFFLASDTDSRAAMAGLFLAQAVLLALSVVAALGGALERARILALAVISFLFGTLVYALPANWIWGGGWLAELGRDAGLGHGTVDLGGAGVIHLSAGALALVLAIELGPRHGRFGRRPAPIPGHNLPLAILGALAFLAALAAVSAMAGPEALAGLAAANTLLGAAGGLILSFILALYRTKRLDPTMLCRGMLGGAIAVSAGAALLEAWAAVLIGAVAGVLVQETMRLLERRQIDDPVGAVAVHGSSGAWGLVALGLFANGSTSRAINDVDGPVRGLLTAHDGRQLLAQVIGALADMGIVLGLGFLGVVLTHKIMGIRVKLAEETGGLDQPKLGVLGYQADEETEEEVRS